jgi:glycosyltransferase involved in cell wall biosynthesis
MSAKNPKISVIMPVKGYEEEVLRRSVNSIVSQSYENFELIIKHNGTQQESAEIKSLLYDDRVKIYTSPDESVANACNQAMEMCSGDLICVFAHDDMYRPDAFQTLIDNLDGSKWYFGNINYYRHNELKGSYYIPYPTMSDMQKNNMIPQPACFWFREVYEAIGTYDESFKLCWDYDYWIRIMKKWPPKHISFFFADYFLNNDSISLRFPKLMEIEKKRIKEKHFYV